MVDSNVMKERVEDSLREHVLHIITESGGIKSTDLEKQIWDYLGKGNPLNKSLEAAGLGYLVNTLVDLHKIVEIEYNLPGGGMRSFYLPTKSQVNIRE